MPSDPQPSPSARPLSHDVRELRDHYDTLIIGSGYGGSVAACRLSAGLPNESVALLEAGKEWPLEALPDSARGVMSPLRYTRWQCMSRLPAFGSSTALFHVTTSATTSVVQGCGLGGGSLINAAVVTWPEDRVFHSDAWPTELKADVITLCTRDRHAASEMLQPATYPHQHAKMRIEAVKAAGLENGHVLRDAELAINMADGHVHPVSGVVQKGCIGCGNCCGGCAIGAKNTLGVNYLPVAAQQGVHIFTEVEVRAIQPMNEMSGGRQGYLVHFAYPALPGLQLFERASGVVHASRVIVSAGCINTFKLLANSRMRYGLPISAALGSRFSANGAAWHVMAERPDVGRGLSVAAARKLPLEERPGPCISHTMDSRGSPRMIDGVHMQPATAPLLADRLLQLAMLLGGKWSDLRFVLPRVVRAPPLSLLSEGHDSGSGFLRYHAASHTVQVDWPDICNEQYIAAAEEIARLIAPAWGVEHFRGWRPILPSLGGLLTELRRRLGRRNSSARSCSTSKHVIITHPLGGVVMANSAAAGVVNHKSQVFDARGDGVLQGLYVVDGSVVPTSLGANPLLTITALAERVCRLILADVHHEPADAGTAAVRIHRRINGRRSSHPKPVGVYFTERMVGTITNSTSARVRQWNSLSRSASIAVARAKRLSVEYSQAANLPALRSPPFRW